MCVGVREPRSATAAAQHLDDTNVLGSTTDLVLHEIHVVSAQYLVGYALACDPKAETRNPKSRHAPVAAIAAATTTTNTTNTNTTNTTPTTCSHAAL